jgi:hypothetical protein
MVESAPSSVVVDRESLPQAAAPPWFITHEL